MPTRVLITGCRHWEPVALARRVVARLSIRYGDDLVIVHGDATGVDRTFAAVAKQASIATEAHPADWGRHGKAAGPKRNAAMVALGAAFAIAVHRDLWGSKGTRDCAARCLAAGIPVYLIDSDDGEPVRIREIPG
jgi:hypothetical protein